MSGYPDVPNPPQNTGVHGLTALIYFVYFWIGVILILLLSSWIIKGTVMIIIFFSQYWLQVSIQIEGLGLLSLEQAVIISNSERSVLIIENIQLSLFDMMSFSIIKIYIEKFRLEHLSVLPTFQHNSYRIFKLLSYLYFWRYFRRRHKSASPYRNNGLLCKVKTKFYRWLLSWVEFEIGIIELLTSHSEQPELRLYSSISCVSVLPRPSTEGSYSSLWIASAREFFLKVDMWTGPLQGDTITLASVTSVPSILLTRNPLYMIKPLRAAKLSLENVKIKFLERTLEPLLILFRLLSISHYVNTTNAFFIHNSKNRSSSTLLDYLFATLLTSKFVPLNFSLTTSDISISYQTLSSHFLNFKIKSLISILNLSRYDSKNISDKKRDTFCVTSDIFKFHITNVTIAADSSNPFSAIGNLTLGLLQRVDNIFNAPIKTKKKGSLSEVLDFENSFLELSFDMQSVYFNYHLSNLSHFTNEGLTENKHSQGLLDIKDLFEKGKGLFKGNCVVSLVTISLQDCIFAYNANIFRITSKQHLVKLVLGYQSMQFIIDTDISEPARHNLMIISRTENMYAHIPTIAIQNVIDEPKNVTPNNRIDSVKILPNKGAHLWGRILTVSGLSAKLTTSLPFTEDTPTKLEIEGNSINFELSIYLLRAVKNLLPAMLSSAISNTTPYLVGDINARQNSATLTINIANSNIIICNDETERLALLLHTDSISVTRLPTLPSDLTIIGSGVSLVSLPMSESAVMVTTMSQLPYGLVEFDLISVQVSVSKEQRHLLIGSEEMVIKWSPTEYSRFFSSFTCLINYLLEFNDWITTQSPKSPVNVQSQYSNNYFSSILLSPAPKTKIGEVTYKPLLDKILSDWNIAGGFSKVIIQITPHPATHINLEFQSASISLNKGEFSMILPSTLILFDKHDVIKFQNFSLVRMNSAPQEISKSRKLFPGLAWNHNYPIAIAFDQLLVKFPHLYNISLAVDKLINCLKYLKSLHFQASSQNSSSLVIVPPDFLISGKEIIIDLPDDPFEVRLRDQYELKFDEANQRAQRKHLLKEKISQIKFQEGELLSSKKAKTLNESLLEQDAKVYIERWNLLYKNNPMRHWVLRIKFTNAVLSVLADPTLQGKLNLLRKMSQLNPEAPIPPYMEFLVLWGRYTEGSVNKIELNLRDYSQPLTTIDTLHFQGVVLGAEQRGSELSTREEVIHMASQAENIIISRNVCPLKFYHDLTVKAKRISFSWGSSFEPAWHQVVYAVEKLHLQSTDHSKPLPFWDRIRIKRHGPFALDCDKFTVHVLANKDPYNNTESLVVDMKQFNFSWMPCHLYAEGNVSFYVSTATKYDECRIAYLPKATLDIEMNWITPGNPMDHHSVSPVNFSKLTSSDCTIDSYADFRSTNLDLNINFRIMSQPNLNTLTHPTFLLYASTIRWLKIFQSNILRNVTRPTRRGPLFQNTGPLKGKLSRHYRYLTLNLNMEQPEISYWSSYTSAKGIILKLDNFSLDSKYKLVLKHMKDRLIHRPQAKIYTLTCLIRIPDLHADTSSQSNFVTGIVRTHLVSLGSLKYTYSGDEMELDSAHSYPKNDSYKHHIEANNCKLVWNTVNRQLLLILYESYEANRVLRENLSTEALRVISLLKKSLQHEIGNDQNNNNSSSSNNNDKQADTYNMYDSPQKKSKTLDLDRYYIELQEFDSHLTNDSGANKSLQDTVYENRWLINLSEIQLALCCEKIHSEDNGKVSTSLGWVVITSAQAFIMGLLHNFQWSKGDLFQKKSWEARLNLMQYFATPVLVTNSHPESIPWLHKSLVLGEIYTGNPIFEALATPTHAKEQDNLVLCGTYPTEADNVSLQRIAYSSYCNVVYATFEEIQSEDTAFLDEKQLTASRESLGSTSSLNAELHTSFTLKHPELNIATSSIQYGILWDIVNNLLLHFDVEKKRSSQRYAKLKFELQLKDNRHELSHLLTQQQNKVRSLVARVHQIEKSIYTTEHSRNRTRPHSWDSCSLASYSTNNTLTADSISIITQDMRSQLTQAREELASCSLDLKLLIKYIKEVEFMSSVDFEFEDDDTPPLTRQVEIWLDEAKWTLLLDGQISIANLYFCKAYYCKSNKQDGSGENRFELASLVVTNCLPNTPFPEALYPYDPDCSKPKIDREWSLRFYLKERASVGGICVKEHLELNLVPLTVRITRRFYKTIFSFFFTSGGPISAKESLEAGIVGDDAPEISLELISCEKSAELSENIERMTERSSNNSFIYIKIPEVPLCISYRGNKEKNIEDVRDFLCVLGPLEYHNQIYTWSALFVLIKKELKKILMSQAIKKKIGFRTPSMETGASKLSSRSHVFEEEEEKAKLLGVRKTVNHSKKKNKKHKKQDSLTTTYHDSASNTNIINTIPSGLTHTDDSDQSDFTSSLNNTDIINDFNNNNNNNNSDNAGENSSEKTDQFIEPEDSLLL